MMQGETYAILNCIIDGEILKASKGSGELGKGPVAYTVLATFPNGSQGIIDKVPVGTMFGGIGDNMQFRLRGTWEGGSKKPTDAQMVQDGSRSATVGDRVLIAFIGGHINRPMIVGFSPHPSTNWRLEKHADTKPQGSLDYLGVSFAWDENGEFQIVRRGAPEVKFSPKMGGALGALTAGLSVTGSSGSDDLTLPPETTSLVPAKKTETVRMHFFKGGGFRLNDSVGQMFEMDHEKNRIYISNNDKKSTEAGSSDGPQIATNSTDAEYILFDKKKELVLINARKIAQIYSFDARKDVTEGAYTSEVKGTLTWTVKGNVKEVFGAGLTTTVEADLAEKVSGSYSANITGDYKVSVSGSTTISSVGALNIDTKGAFSAKATGDFVASGGAGLSTLTLSKGKVSLKGATGEVIDLLVQLVDGLLQLSVPTSVGPSGPPLNSAIFIQIKALLSGMKA